MAADRRMQSAIEYLQTYAWAFIILAIVVAVLAYFGIFGMNTKLRLPPGSCFVNRPYGPNTTQFLSLSGNCNGDLPEYVIHFNGQLAGGYEGDWFTDVDYCASSGYCVGFPSPLQWPQQVGCNLTMNAWSYDIGMGSRGAPSGFPTATGDAQWQASDWPPGVYSLGGVVALWNTTWDPINSGEDYADFDIEYNDTIMRFEAADRPDLNQFFVVSNSFFVPSNGFTNGGNFKDRWVMTTLTVDNGVAMAYIDGIPVSPPSPQIDCSYLVSNYMNQGVIGMWDRAFNGTISNVQIYDIALGANTVHAMYTDGMGQVPLDPIHLIGWWQLNGNANDSSGNGNNGQGAGWAQLTYTDIYPEPPSGG